MNGYEVCARLKATENLADIPVIFLSALNEREDKVKAFRSGAVDYISKPFQVEEVQARVEIHLKLHDLQRALKSQNQSLEEAVAARTRELAQANERLTILDRSKTDFLKLISHELRTPLNGLLGVADLVWEDTPPTEENKELREMFEQSRGRILSILDDALLLTEIDIKGEQFRSAPVSLSKALARSIESTTSFAESRHVTLAPAMAGLGLVVGNEDLLVRALHSLLETAVRFSKEGQTVQLSYEKLSDSLRIRVESHGKAIPDSELPKFFDVFSTGEASTPGKDLGLGPALAFRILSLFGASVGVTNRDPAGITFTVTLRLARIPNEPS
jgi:signal transduction histidine kinase